MDIKQITDTLNKIYADKNNRIVFWYDSEKEFEEILPAIQIPGVAALHMDEHAALELKIRIESEDPAGRYLLYAPRPEPAPEEDWLFDIRLYSHTFHADRASITLNELKLNHQSMRPHIKTRRAFFNSRDRMERLKKWVMPDDLEDDLDLKMLGVIHRSDQPEPFLILMNLFASFCPDNEFNMDADSKSWAEIQKMGLESSFWDLLFKTFGYVNEAGQSLPDFLIRVFVTDLSNQLKGELPPALRHFAIQAAPQAMNSSVFLSQWRSHTGYFKYYNRISAHLEKRLKIGELLLDMEFDNLMDVMTFEAAERRIISSIRDQIQQNRENGIAKIKDHIKRRLDGYWATTAFSGSPGQNLYQTVYHALETAIDLLDLRQKYDAGFTFPGAREMFSAYTNELFRFDQYYRIFHELANMAELAGWDVLKPIGEIVEGCYSGWFMDQLAVRWGDFVQGDESGSLLQKWKIRGAANQYDFYPQYVSPTIADSPRKRLFVIVSDAFRFEAAEELARLINGKYRFKADLEPMLGVLPGYTALGMAALLPHEKITFKEKSGDILVDGKPAGSFDQREAILGQYEATAIRANDLMDMSKDMGREFVRPHRLIYIYHDHIDAVGDKAASEGSTFDAVRKSIDELHGLVNFIINSLNGTRVLVTADHGFIYQEAPPTPIEKSKLDVEQTDAIKSHKRFILGKSLTGTEKAYAGNTRITAHTDTDMQFLIPKGANRFNFIGGARFFHGGAMLQEIVVPVLTVTEMKGKHLEKSEVRQVGVSLIGTYKKLVTNRPIYKFIQTEPVSDRMKPLTLKVSLRDGTELISDEETVTFDSRSPSMDERQKSVKLTLKTGAYDSKKEYYMVLRNPDDTEYDRIPIKIDIAFANDF